MAEYSTLYECVQYSIMQLTAEMKPDASDKSECTSTHINKTIQ